MASTIPNEEEAGPVTAPVRLLDRMPALDILRGFALLGILVLNIESFASASRIQHDMPLDVVSMSGPHHAADVAVMTVQWLFFEGKMRALFATLYGAGTVLLLQRIEHRQGAGIAADIFHRRNMWLMLFGLMHGLLIWDGDILFSYSTVALLALYPLRNVARRTLIVVGLAITIVGGLWASTNLVDLRENWPAAWLQEGARDARLEHRSPTAAEATAVADAAATRQKQLAAVPEKTAERRVSYVDGFASNAQNMLDGSAFYFTSGLFLEVLGLMIAGMGLYKAGFLTGRLSSRTYVVIAAVGYAISVPLVLIGLHHARLFGFSDAINAVWIYMPYFVQEAACMLANASVVLLLVKHGRLVLVQQALGAVGRMAFSNYILTSLICQYLFRWGPWKLYGQLEYHQQIYVVLAIWALNIAVSLVWLRLFAFGPLEWVWRSLTYWKRQPFRAVPVA